VTYSTGDAGRGRGDRKVTPSVFPQRFRKDSFFHAIVALSALLLLATAGFAGTATVSVGATIVSGGFCWITANNANLAFGILDPGNPVDVTRTATLDFQCLGFSSVTYAVTDDDGLYETGPDRNRMRRTAAPVAYLPYSLDVSPRSATVSGNPFILRTLTISGTLLGADYLGAIPGNYSDTVLLTINP
jgi:spore coat protein U-like protein